MATKSMKWELLKPLGLLPTPRLGHTVTSLVGSNGVNQINSDCNDEYILAVFAGAAPEEGVNNELYLLSMVEQSPIGSNDSGCNSNSNSNNSHTENKNFVYQWNLVAKQGNDIPSPRYSHTTVLGKSNGEEFLIVFGGSDSEDGIFNDVHIIDTQKWIWKKPDIKGTVPLPRTMHGSAVLGNNMYVWGGATHGGVPVDDDMIHVLNLDTWTWSTTLETKMKNKKNFNDNNNDKDKLSIPSMRSGHSLTFIGSKLYVYGGLDGNRNVLSDIYCYDTETDIWHEIEIENAIANVNVNTSASNKRPRSGHSASYYDDGGDQKGIIVFGGMDLNQCYDELFFIQFRINVNNDNDSNLYNNNIEIQIGSKPNSIKSITANIKTLQTTTSEDIMISDGLEINTQANSNPNMKKKKKKLQESSSMNNEKKEKKKDIINSCNPDDSADSLFPTARLAHGCCICQRSQNNNKMFILSGTSFSQVLDDLYCLHFISA